VGLAQWRHPDVGVSVRAPLPEVAGWRQRRAAVLHTLRLDGDPERVYRTFKRTQIQQCIAQAGRQGVTAHRGTAWADMRAFYGLHLQTRRRQGTPVQPLRFFRLIWERLLQAGQGFVCLASQHGRVIAGAVFLAWNGTVIYKYSASDPSFWSARPNHLVLWTAIRWACTNGFSVFDFGRTDVENAGLRTFKNGWGTREEPLIYSSLGGEPADTAAAAASATSAVRAQAARAAHDLIRRSPAWVCRALGEVLYRYAA
jgi:lipid II:glycine glycyltransferase (peptidoglycan interpeptide bridge formation enzyme)